VTPPLQADEEHKQEKIVLSVTYSPDGKRLARGAIEGTVTYSRALEDLAWVL